MFETVKTYTVDEARKRLEHYCAYQERCHQEVQQKLKSMNMIPEASDIIIVHLLKHNFLNEERFAKTFVRGKFNIKKWGKHRLTRELKRKDISKYNVNQALKEINEEDYLQAFNDLAKKRVQLIREKDKYKKKEAYRLFIVPRLGVSFGI